MSQEINTQKPLSKLLNATQLAFIASIILHLLIYKYGFAKSMIRERKLPVEGTVATIELSPTEVERLPNLETRLEVPDFNNSVLGNTSSPFAFPSSITPTIGNSTNLPAVPIPFPPNFNLPSIPFIPSISTNIKLPPISDFSALPLPPPPEELKSATTPTSIPELPGSKIPRPPTQKQPIKPPETKIKPKPTPEQIAAARQEKLQDNIQSLSSSLKKQETGTTDEDARKNYLAWLTKVKSIEPEAIELEGTYPRDACIRRLEGKSIYGVVTDEKNTVVALELIKGAEYPIFNRQANKDLRKKNFGNNTGEPKPYRVTVNYKYNAEICPSLTVPSLRKKTEPSQPTPEAKPETTPETKPETTPEAKPETTPETKPETTPETKPETTPEAKPETTPEAKPETTPEAKPETTPEAKPETTPETKPETTPKPQEKTPLPSLRERLQNAPLLEDDSIRERLRKNPLPPKE